jgi:hypothetical protein
MFRNVTSSPVVSPTPNDVPHRQHPGHLAAVDDDQVAKATADHLRGCSFQRPVRRGEDQVLRQVIADLLGVRRLAGACLL